MHRKQAPDRYEAAIRWEKARRRIRELRKLGLPATDTDAAEVVAARREYEAATAAVR